MTHQPDDPSRPARPEPVGDPARRRPHGMTDDGHVRSTRAGAWWTALVVVAVLSIFFLVFIAQNADAVTIRFLAFEGQLSLAVALLLSLAVGILLAAIPGMLRILQLRRALERNAKDR